eukprot:CAMPEP_0178926036 /NCGR_PEP_ID=MMETSP0786-20121207/18278_1 /TAXON_ID=186022 /ORGANISM="Thalassionema frauenfeldii, Strain CCMP 1798" /LENGTH=393 /DNA_ID=CAMNT_0020601051 /DNA_START=1 /DNA_END=1182 /DNA_ORIENTATION=-
MTTKKEKNNLINHGYETALKEEKPKTKESLQNSKEDSEWNPLLPHIQDGPIRSALLTDGYAIIRNVLTEEECEDAVNQIWDFLEDTSNNVLRRDDPNSWYDENCWPSTGYTSFADMFQSLGVGWLLGTVRELLVERVYEKLIYQNHRLHCSKEGFTMHRPTLGRPDFMKLVQERKVCVSGQIQSLAEGEHYDQCHASRGLWTIQSLVALEDQVEGVDGHFKCWPGSFGQVHQTLTKDIYRGRFSWIPLNDKELLRLENEFELKPKRVYLNKGDVVVWRSDLVHAPQAPSGETPRFRAVAYCACKPSSFTSEEIMNNKLEAYLQRRTSDYRPDMESWHEHRNTNGRHYYREGVPIVTVRQAELYGLLPYNDKLTTEERIQDAKKSGVRFIGMSE